MRDPGMPLLHNNQYQLITGIENDAVSMDRSIN
jgi:hypothetical protein